MNTTNEKMTRGQFWFWFVYGFGASVGMTYLAGPVFGFLTGIGFVALAAWGVALRDKRRQR